MASDKEKREELVKLIDKKKLHDVQRSTESEKRRFRGDYKSAREVRENYLSDLSSSTGKKKSKELEELGLPTLPSIKDDFLAKCDELGVS